MSDLAIVRCAYIRPNLTVRLLAAIAFVLLVGCKATPGVPTRGDAMSRRASEFQMTGGSLQEIDQWASTATYENSSNSEIEAAIRHLRGYGASGDSGLTPGLKAIAETASEGYVGMVALEALDACWRLGVSPSSFLAYARGFSEKPMLAFFARLVLGRAADASYVAEMNRIRDGAQATKAERSNFVESAATRANQVVQYAGHFQSLASIQEQVGLLSTMSLGQAAPLALAELSSESPFERNDPLVVWARNRIYMLSMDSPVETANALLQFSFDSSIPPGASGSFDREALRWRYRERVSSFLTPESQQACRSGKPLK